MKDYAKSELKTNRKQSKMIQQDRENTSSKKMGESTTKGEKITDLVKVDMEE